MMSARGPSIAPRTNLAPSPAGTGSASSPESGSAASPGTVTSIVTSREWVLPPRPKPGRKPSVDTPASKRKAQNRAAQRAFRERRATRVQELEQQLLEVEKEKEIKEMGLVNTINKLKFENQILSKSVEQLRQEFHSFRGSQAALPIVQSAAPSPATYAYTGKPHGQAPHGNYPASVNGSTNIIHSSRSTNPTNTANNPASMATNAYKAEINQSAQHLLNFAKSLPGAHGSAVSPALLLYSVQQILPAPSADSPGGPMSRSHPHPHNHNHNNNHNHNLNLVKALSPQLNAQNGSGAAEDFDCGVCIKEQCLCEDVGLKTSKSLEDTFSSFAPIPAVSLRSKRKQSTGEVDFTAEFSVKKMMPDLKRLRKSSSGASGSTGSGSSRGSTSAESFNEGSPLDDCGFCSDDTPCVCREAAKEAARIKELSERQDQGLEDEKLDIAEEAGPTLLPPIQVKHPSIMRKASLPVMHPGPTFELRDISNIPQNSVPSMVSQEVSEALLAAQQSTEDDADKSGCTGNPGTCSQCQTDPMSTLFCSTVASKAAQQTVPAEEPVSTPSNKANDYFSSPRHSLTDTHLTSLAGGSTNPSTPIASTPGGTSNGIFIPCADAYRTLSRHKRFNTIDFLSLVGRLTTRGMQVEVQSVANMIRELDKKVYD